MKKPSWHLSAGTVIVCLFTVAVLLTGWIVYQRISGDSIKAAGYSAKPESLAAASSTENPGGTEGSATTSNQTTRASETAAPQPTQKPSTVFTLVSSGIVQVGKDLREAAEDEDGTYDFAGMLQPVRYLLTGEISVTGLRSLLTDDASSYGTYVAPASLAAALRQSGVNAVNIGSDHILDRGLAGVQKTRDVLNSETLAAFGAYESIGENSHGITGIIEGTKIGLVSFTQQTASKDDETAGAVHDLNAAIEDIIYMKNQGAEMIVVCCWWGKNEDKSVTSALRDSAQQLAEAGVDLILGYGPAAVLDIEKIQTLDLWGKAHECVVAYSLGTFLSDASRNRESNEIMSIIARVQIKIDHVSGTIEVEKFDCVPTWIMRWRDSSQVQRYRVVPAGSAEIPEGMSDSVYRNMQTAYRKLAEKLGSDLVNIVSE